MRSRRFRSNTDRVAPRGKEILSHLTTLEDESEIFTSKLLLDGQLGRRAPAMMERLGNGLSLLSLIGSCAWGCHNGTHLPENLARRFHNSIRSSIRLAYIGYYEDALALVRVAAEMANLIQLFSLNDEEFQRWIASSPNKRISNYGGRAVRDKIETMKAVPIVGKERYASLCEAGVHITPESAKQSHDLEGTKVYVGPTPSPTPGFFVVLTEIVYLLGHCLPCITRLAQRDDKMALAETQKTELITTLPSFFNIRSYNKTLSYFRKKYSQT